VTVLDAYAVVAHLRGENATEEVAELLRSPTWMCAVNPTEVMDQLIRVDGHDRDEVETRIAARANDNEDQHLQEGEGPTSSVIAAVNLVI